MYYIHLSYRFLYFHYINGDFDIEFTYNPLGILVVLPIFIGIFYMFVINFEIMNKGQIFNLSMFFTTIIFLIAISIWTLFDSGETDLQFVSTLGGSGLLTIKLGLDGINLYYVLLTATIVPLCIMTHYNNKESDIPGIISIYLIIESLLILFFLTDNFIVFYSAFEAVVLPVFILIGTYNSARERVRSAFMLLLFTLTGSLFMLLSINYLIEQTRSVEFATIQLLTYNFDFDMQKFVFLGIFVAFCVKAPLFPFHVWLPYAHSEAPTGGSMLLASLMLKLATYGFIRILVGLMPEASQYYTPLVQVIAIVTLIYSSFATLRQSDFKALVAYSSISHMAIVVLGVFSNNIIGIEGAILLSIAHGFISPAMFMLVGSVIYDRGHTRTIAYYRGLSVFMPVFSILFFIVTMCNMGVPLSMNWIGEVMSLTGIFQQSVFVGIVASSSIVLSACYSIFLYNRISFGSYSPYQSEIKDIGHREFVVVIPIIILTVILGIVPNVVLNDLHVAVSQLLY